MFSRLRQFGTGLVRLHVSNGVVFLAAQAGVASTGRTTEKFDCSSTFQGFHSNIGVDYQHKIDETRSVGLPKTEALDQIGGWLQRRRIQVTQEYKGASDEERRVDFRERVAAKRSMVMNKRRSFVTGLLGLAGLSSVKRAAADEGRGVPLLFKYRNVVTKFSPTAPPSATITFAGADLGTVEGVLSGTLLQNFSVTVNTSTGAATTGPDNSLFTDLDLDQISFEYQGTGTFLPPIPNLNGLMSAGGSLAVTYKVLNASGKYKFLIGRQFTAKVVATNALPGAVSGGVLGSVYAEVYAPDAEFILGALNRGQD